jgi:hypothetical protein
MDICLSPLRCVTAVPRSSPCKDTMNLVLLMILRTLESRKNDFWDFHVNADDVVVNYSYICQGIPIPLRGTILGYEDCTVCCHDQLRFSLSQSPVTATRI